MQQSATHGNQARTYRRPPITEAVIEWRFSNPISPKDVEALRENFATRFPIVQQVQIQALAAGIPAAVDTATPAYRMSDLDSTTMLMVGSAQIAFSMLAPYPGWEVFYRRGTDVYANIRKIIGYLDLSRVAIRYINRLDVLRENEGTPVLISDYLTIGPEYSSPTLPPLKQFTMQTEFALADVDCVATITVAGVPSPLPHHTGLLLDIDIGRNDAVPQNEADINAMLNTMRDAKNRIFEGCITDAARALFDR